MLKIWWALFSGYAYVHKQIINERKDIKFAMTLIPFYATLLDIVKNDLIIV